MFRSCALISTSAVLLTILVWTSYLYNKPEPTKKTLSVDHPSLTSNGKQERKQVRKDIWIAQSPSERLHSRIESDNSTLFLTPKGNSIDVTEKLTGVRCWMQEKTYLTNGLNTQQMRFFVAKEGFYHYQNQDFEASNVLLSMYRIPGLDLIRDLENRTPFLKGSAEKVVFSLQKGTPVFQATHFKASSQGTTP